MWILQAAGSAPASIPGFSEPFSSVSHLGGATIFAFLGVRLVLRGRGRVGRVICLAVYAVSVVSLLSLSGVYHSLDPANAAREVLRRLDHAAIFALIAGTFTAAHGILFTGVWRWGVIALLWSLAAAGITVKTIFFESFPEPLGLSIYLGMGWLGIVSAVKLWRIFHFDFVRPLLVGAVAYTGGALVEYLRAPTLWPGIFGPHELFHVAVLVGIASHWRFIQQFAAAGEAGRTEERSC